MRQLPVAAHLAAAVDESYAEATVGLQLALQSVCSGFRAERYAKVSVLPDEFLTVPVDVDTC